MARPSSLSELLYGLDHIRTSLERDQSIIHSPVELQFTFQRESERYGYDMSLKQDTEFAQLFRPAFVSLESGVDVFNYFRVKATDYDTLRSEARRRTPAINPAQEQRELGQWLRANNIPYRVVR